MQKFKEAMQNLMSKMKQQPTGDGQKQSSEMAQNGKQGKQQQGAGKKDGSQGQKQSDGAAVRKLRTASRATTPKPPRTRRPRAPGRATSSRPTSSPAAASASRTATKT